MGIMTKNLLTIIAAAAMLTGCADRTPQPSAAPTNAPAARAQTCETSKNEYGFMAAGVPIRIVENRRQYHQGELQGNLSSGCYAVTVARDAKGILKKGFYDSEDRLVGTLGPMNAERSLWVWRGDDATQARVYRMDSPKKDDFEFLYTERADGDARIRTIPDHRRQVYEITGDGIKLLREADAENYRPGWSSRRGARLGSGATKKTVLIVDGETYLRDKLATRSAIKLEVTDDCKYGHGLTGSCPTTRVDWDVRSGEIKKQ
jgi:hypothetical protein